MKKILITLFCWFEPNVLHPTVALPNRLFRVHLRFRTWDYKSHPNVTLFYLLLARQNCADVRYRPSRCRVERCGSAECRFAADGAVASKRSQVTSYVQYIAPSQTTGQPVLARYYFHNGVVQHLPNKDAEWKYGRCAVVSNSGELLTGPMHGEEIGEPAQDGRGCGARPRDVTVRVICSSEWATDAYC